MPVVINMRLPGSSKLGVWKLTEELAELEDIFPLLPMENSYYASIRNERRKREWLIARILLTELLERRVLISYTEHGKPFIDKNEINISITHSKNFVSILISNKLVPGIDIEHITDRVDKVKHKFLDENELNWCLPLEAKTLCWSAKEAIFKTYEKELDFHDIQIEKFDISDSHFTANVLRKDKEKSFKVFFKRIEDDVLTYTFTTN